MPKNRTNSLMLLIALIGTLLPILPQSAAIAIDAPQIIVPTPTLEYLWEAGTANTGTTGGSCTLGGNAQIIYDAGRQGNVLSLDNNGDYCQQLNGSGLTAGAQFTIMAAYKTENAVDETVISIGNNSNSSSMRLAITNNTIKIVMVGGTVVTLHNDIYDNNEWHHVAVTFNSSSGETKIYLDGIAIYSLYSSWTTPNQNVNVGRRTDGYYFGGTIDDVRIYNVELSTGQIQTILWGDATPINPEDNLILRYEFQEMNTRFAADSSGNDNTGIVYQGPSPYGWLAHSIDAPVTPPSAATPNETGINSILAAANITGTGYTVMGYWYDEGINENQTWPRIFHISGDSHQTSIIYRYSVVNSEHQYGVEHTTWNGNYVTVSGLPSWLHLAYTWDGTTERLYINADEVYSGTYDVPLAAVDKISWFGDGGPYGERYFNGLADDLRLYNRTLSGDEISEILNPPEPIVDDCGYESTWVLDREVVVDATNANGAALIAQYGPITTPREGFYMIETAGGPWYANWIGFPKRYDTETTDTGMYNGEAYPLTGKVCETTYGENHEYTRAYLYYDDRVFIDGRVHDFLFLDNHGDITFKIYRLASDSPLPVVTNLLRDGDMEQQPSSDYWFAIPGATGTFGRYTNQTAPHELGTAYCGEGFQVIGRDPIYPLTEPQFAPIEQSFYWQGGTAYLHLWYRVIQPPPYFLGSYIIFEFVRNDGTIASPAIYPMGGAVSWGDLQRTVTLDPGTYRIRISAGGGATIAIDEVAITSGIPEAGWTCASSPVFPTPTPNQSVTPTASPTLTPTPDYSMVGLRNCSFEVGMANWNFHDGSYVSINGGPHGPQYAVANSVGSYDISQDVYLARASRYTISGWFASNVEVVMVSRASGVRYVFINANYSDWYYEYASSDTMPEGYYRLELNNGDDHQVGYFDGIWVNEGLAPALGACNNAQSTPTPGAPPNITATATPIRATPTPRPTSSCSTPDDWYMIGAWTQYGICKGKEYTAPQPYHYATMEALPTLVADRDPVAVVYEFSEAMRQTGPIIDSYDWGPGLPGTDDMPRMDVWQRAQDLIQSGYIDLQQVMNPPREVTFACPDNTGIFGPLLMQGICLFFGTLYEAGLIPWIQLLFDTVYVGIFVRYVRRRWIDAGIS